MDLQELYNVAVNIMENLRTAGGNYSVSEDSSVCVMLAQSGRVYSGLNGTKFENGELKKSCSEYNAIMSMMADGETRILKIMTVNFRNSEVVLPCEECKKLILRINGENRSCEIAVSKSGTLSLGILMPDAVLEDTMQDVTAESTGSFDNKFTSSNKGEFTGAMQDVMETEELKGKGLPNAYSNKTVSTMQDLDIPETVSNYDNTEESISASEFDISNNFGFEPADTPSSAVDYVTDVKADESNPFYEPPNSSEKNIVRDGNIEFEMYDPNASRRASKPKALHQKPTSSLDPEPEYNPYSSSNQGYSGSSYSSGASNTDNSGNTGNTDSSNSGEQYQSPYKQQHAHSVSSSYYQSQMSVSFTDGESGDGSIFRQRLNNLLSDGQSQQSSGETPSSKSSTATPENKKELSKFEMLKVAKEKKKQAKIDAKFQKKLKKKGY